MTGVKRVLAAGLLAVLTSNVMLLSCSGCQSSAVTARPYVQNPTQDSITIKWASGKPGQAFVHYGHQGLTGKIGPIEPSEFTYYPQGTKAEPSRGAAHTEYLYHVVLDSLTPGTRYDYRVVLPDSQFDGSFKTAPAGTIPFSFAAYGDTRTDFLNHRRVAKVIRDARPDLIIHTGDITDSGAYREYQPQFFMPLHDVISHIPIFTALGNHDGHWNVYKSIFSLPSPVRWYTFNYSNVHFIALDSNAGPSNRPAMIDWLEKTLAESQADWKVVYYHHPSYDVTRRRTSYGRKDILPLLRKYKVDLVLTGHSHGYQRMRPFYTRGHNEDHPITHMVVAGGGAPLHNIAPNTFAASTAKAYCFTMFRIDGRRLVGQTIGIDGQVFDEFVIDKTAGPISQDYLAQALPEEDFDKLHEFIASQLRGLRLPRLPQPDKPVAFSFPFTAPPDAEIAIKLFLAETKSYSMDTVRATVPAGQTEQISVTLRAHQEITIRGDGLHPQVMFECHFRSGADAGVVVGGKLRCMVQAQPDDAPPANDEDEP